MGYVELLENATLLCTKILSRLKVSTKSLTFVVYIQQVGKSSLDLSEKKFMCGLMGDLSELLIIE